jgi:hypothetical protein
MLKKVFLANLAVFSIAILARSQELEVDRYNINAQIDVAANAMDVRAQLALSNLSQSSKPKLYLRLTKLAKINSAAVGGLPAQVEAVEDRRVPALNQIAVTPQAPLGPGRQTTLELSYRLEVPDSSAIASIYPGEVVLLPESVWFPMPSTQFTIYGATAAPFLLAVTVENMIVASAGSLKVEGQTFIFEQPLNSFPLIVAGSFDQPVAGERGGVKLEVYLQSGLSSIEGSSSRGQAARLLEEASRAIDFFSRLLGPAPQATFRIISSARAGQAITCGALVLNEQAFRQDVLDATTIEALADAIARIWIEGRARIRGQVAQQRPEAEPAQPERSHQKSRSFALLRDSLPRYLAALYFEDRFGPDAAAEMFSRMRWAYTPVARGGRDAELAVQTLLVPTYSAAALAKGPIVLRMIAAMAGRDKFIAALRSLISGPQNRVVTPGDFRAELVKAAGPALEKVFEQWIDSIAEPDIVIGVPQAESGGQRVNLRNLGTGDVTVQVLAITESGKKITLPVTVPSEDLTSLLIPTNEKITSVEVDPEKLIIQTNYDNDSRPPKPDPLTLFNEGVAAFNKGEHAKAEQEFREAVSRSPNNPLLRAHLARSLLAQGKRQEAAAEAQAAMRILPPVASAIAWARIVLAEVAMAEGRHEEAINHLRRATVEAQDAPAQLASREALIRAERQAGRLPAADESIRSFITQLDALIKQPSSEKLYAAVYKSTLKRFVQGLTVSPPSSWATEVLRAEPIDANRAAVDVAIKARAEGRDQSGTAVFLLHKYRSNWMLEDIRLFNVK